MRGNILAVIKKELRRFFGDRRMVFSTIILPAVMIYVAYSFMGTAISGMFTPDEGYKYSVSAVSLPPSVAGASDGLDLEFTVLDANGVGDAKAAVENQELDLVAVFPPDFDEAVAAYDIGSGLPAPTVELYYNSIRTESQAAYSILSSVLDGYESSLANKFDVNPGGEGFDMASERDSTGFMFSSMLPMLLMIFLFTGCMSVAPEAIAGEKERGTIATMLITPVKRSELAVGKIVALSIIALCTGASSTIGTLLSMPKLMGGAMEGMSAAYYSVGDYILLAAVVLSTVLLFVSLISLVSAYAKTIKEAQTTVTPIMVVVMLVGVTSMFGGGAKEGLGYYLIPVYNSVQSMAGIFSFNATPRYLLVTVAVNVLLSVIGGFLLTRMFNSESVMFKK